MLSDGAHATVRDCTVADCGNCGISVVDFGTRLALSDSRITGNKSNGVYVLACTADVQNCEIRNNGDTGVWVQSGGSGTFRNNRLSGNENGNWDIDSDSTVTRTGNTPNE